MSLEPYSLKGYDPIDSIEQDAPLGHGVQQNFGADTRKTGHGKKSSFWKSKDGRQYARRKDGRIITHDAEELGGDDASLADFSGVDSVVVEAPLGHGVTQYYSEDEPEPNFNDGITGQDGPETEPTNSHFSAQGYDDKQDESIGMRHRGKHSQSRKDRRDEASAMDKKGRRGRKYDDVATMDAQGYDDKMDESLGMRHRGKHSQSRKDRRDEASAMDKRHSKMGRKYDDVATMDAEHTHWHNKSNGQFYGKWSKHKKNGQFSTHNSEYTQLMGPTVEANDGGLHSPSSFDITWEDGSGLSSASMPPNEIHFADSHDAEFTLEKPVKTGFMVAFGAGLFSLAAVAGTVLVGNLLGGNE
tara:strand:- start:877 stop:1947 length:1071 start_codon:yes stop_codon:yes gene_type:complete